MFHKDKIYYQGLDINRSTEERKDSGWVIAQWHHPQCRVLLLHNQRNLMVWDRQTDSTPIAISHSREQADAVLPDFEHLVFLGLDKDTPVFAADDDEDAL